MNGVDFYISSNGRFVIPSLDISYLINIKESDIPAMPQAVDTVISIAGADGDKVLGTVYKSLSFNIVCYTESGLSALEKRAEEIKLYNFLNSMKVSKKTFGIEDRGISYSVKFSGNVSIERGPTHVSFAIPLKSEDSFGRNLTESRLVGAGTIASNTVKEVGTTITILGPAVNPTISLNDTNMYYENSILEGNYLEIDTGNSTVTHINNTTGIRTNAMRYYNHRFPRIQNGNNVLLVVSGIEDDTQVSMSFYDLKF